MVITVHPKLVGKSGAAASAVTLAAVMLKQRLALTTDAKTSRRIPTFLLGLQTAAILTTTAQMLAPEDAVGITVEFAEQRRQVAHGLDERVLQPTVVSIARVERPEAGFRVPHESADPPPGPVRTEVLSPGRPALVERDRVSSDRYSILSLSSCLAGTFVAQ